MTTVAYPVKEVVDQLTELILDSINIKRVKKCTKWVDDRHHRDVLHILTETSGVRCDVHMLFIERKLESRNRFFAAKFIVDDIPCRNNAQL